MERLVQKRDGSLVPYEVEKIAIAIYGAFTDLDKEFNDIRVLDEVEDLIKHRLGWPAKVEDIQDIVEEVLWTNGYIEEGRAYTRYRYKRELVRKANTTDKTIKELLDGESEYWNKENSNKDARVAHTQRDYLAGITSTDITRRFLLPKDVVEAHDAGIIHFHDADYFAQNAIHNCELINLEDMLQNGTVINGVMIDKPHRIITAATIATQIIAAVTSSSYGGATISLTHLAPFVRDSWNKYYLEAKEELREINFNDNISFDESCQKIANKRTKKEIKDAVQTFLYQTNSMTNTNGQSPFLSVFMYLGETDIYKKELALLIEEFLKQRILGFKNKQGVYIAPAFPKYLYVLEEDNIHEDSPYWYLTKIAAECTSKRMVPDYISEKKMKELKLSVGEEPGEGDCYPCMGCRSFLTPDRSGNGFDNIAKAGNYDGKPKYYGRFNQGVVTINLADVGLSARKYASDNNWIMIDGKYQQEQLEKVFWDILDERLELCHKALQIRHKRLANVTSDVAPILWQNGALARLEPGESIHKLLHSGYSTLSLGYAALYECVLAVTGYSHTDKENGGYDFAIRIMQKLNDKCSEWKAAEDIDYSIYASPIENTTYKFAKCLKKRFGIIPGITDRDYVTNSYHVNVKEEIDAFDKLTFESEFQRLSPGGMISYIESCNLDDNVEVIYEIIKHIYNNTMYAEINLAIDYCNECGYSGEMKTDEELNWYCPNCGNDNQDTMNIARRTCGYIGTHYWSKGRTQEIVERYRHIDDHDAQCQKE